MEVVAAFTDDNIPNILNPTKAAFMKLLEKRRNEIENFPRRTFRYGNTDRHQLDVYYPDPASSTKPPVLFFEYGGGFNSGDRQNGVPYDLGYANVGAFFAQRGIMVVIADYRLSPEARFPEPVEDIRDAISWFLTNTSTVTAASPYPTALTEVGKLYVMGHSAGANHIITLYLSPSVLPLDSPIRTATAGLIPKGGAFEFDFSIPIAAPGVLESYYGSQEATLENMPNALLDKASDELVASLPDMYVLASEREPQYIRQVVDIFVEKMGKRLGKPVKYDIMKGHNHISPHWALLSGEGEEWAEDVAAWVKAMRS